MSGGFAADLGPIFGAAFSAVMPSGVLHKQTTVYATKGGGITESWTDHPCSVQRDVCTQRMRTEAGYTDTDVRLLILRAGLQCEAPTTADEVTTADGLRWAVASFDFDAASGYFDCRGSKTSPRA